MPQSTDVYARLMARSVVTESGCYEWQGTVDRGGYGKTTYLGRFTSTHRLAYKTLGPEFDHSLTLDHLCRNRRCWRTEHLEPVTMQVNVTRGDGWSGINARTTHCPKGHEYNEDNTRVRYRPDRGGSYERDCRACERGRKRVRVRRAA